MHHLVLKPVLVCGYRREYAPEGKNEKRSFSLLNTDLGNFSSRIRRLDPEYQK